MVSASSMVRLDSGRPGAATQPLAEQQQRAVDDQERRRHHRRAEQPAQEASRSTKPTITAGTVAMTIAGTPAGFRHLMGVGEAQHADRDSHQSRQK